MEKHIIRKKYKLTKQQRLILLSYIKGQIGPLEAAAKIGTNRTRLNSIVSAILLNAAMTGEVDAVDLLSIY